MSEYHVFMAHGVDTSTFIHTDIHHLVTRRQTTGITET